jgi:hypothetical protein
MLAVGAWSRALLQLVLRWAANHEPCTACHHTNVVERVDQVESEGGSLTHFDYSKLDRREGSSREGGKGK